MIPFIEEIEEIKNQLIKLYNPSKIILFGSCAKGIAKKDSDIDLCVIGDYDDKKSRLMDMLINIESHKDNEWIKYIQDTATFASLINREGVVLYGSYTKI